MGFSGGTEGYTRCFIENKSPVDRDLNQRLSEYETARRFIHLKAILNF